MSAYIDCKNVVKAYWVGDHELVALKGIDFRMERGEMVAIVGPSGAGKSSLLNLLGGLDRPTAGQLTVDGINLLDLKGRQLTRYRSKMVGLVWQNVGRNLLGHRNALHNVTLPMMVAGVPYHQRRRHAMQLLEAVGLADHIHKRPATLSGGQQQRVAIAVALANQPALLLADEPTGALDRQSALQVMNLLAELRREYHLTVMLVTHDPEMANFADRVLTLRDGALGQDLTHEDTAQNPHIDREGRIQLPDAIRLHLQSADHIAMEIRPEGVLLRPEQAEEAMDLLFDALPTPSRRRWWKLGRR